MKGTGLRPYLDTAGPEHAGAFIEAYRARIAELYAPMADGRVLFRFPRLFVVALRA
jgi:trans-aconitate 2-methyltransferase